MEILAINPPVYDFACYDLWLKPLGFLHILSFLKKIGHRIVYFDFMDRCSPYFKEMGVTIKSDKFGCGKFYSEEAPLPQVYSDVKRKYKRYGIPSVFFKNFLEEQNPDLILISSSMCYWYLGIKEVVNTLRKRFGKRIKIVLGGTYACLCKEHAQKNIDVDFVSSDYRGLDFFEDFLKVRLEEREIFNSTPLYEVYKVLEYVVLRTSWGCPFRCEFCALNEMYKGYYQKPYLKVYEEIEYFYKRGIKNIVFYDDALLYKKENIKLLLELIIKNNLKVNIHTPNGLHAKFIDKEMAHLMKRAGFIDPRISFESSDEEILKKFSYKVDVDSFVKCIENLKKASFKKGEFSVYLIYALPEQDYKRLRSDILFCHRLGCRIRLADFSPIPSSKFTELLDIKDPLLQNNSIFPGIKSKEDLKEVLEIKKMVRELNKKLKCPL